MANSLESEGKLWRKWSARPATRRRSGRTDPYGVFQVKLLKQISENILLVENCANAGKTEIERVQMPIETDLLFPLIRGETLRTWCGIVRGVRADGAGSRGVLAIPEKNLNRTTQRHTNTYYTSSLLRCGAVLGQ